MAHTHESDIDRCRLFLERFMTPIAQSTSGLDQNGDNNGYMRRVLEDASVVMLRIVFILMAETRRILMCTHTYYRNASMTGLIRELTSGVSGLSDYAVWQRLVRCFRLVREGDRELRIPRMGAVGIFAETWLERHVLGEGQGLIPWSDREHDGCVEIGLCGALNALCLEEEVPRRFTCSPIYLSTLYECVRAFSESVTGIESLPQTQQVCLRVDRQRLQSVAVYYTPVLVVESLVYRTVLPCFEEKTKCVSANAKYNEMRDAILSIRVVDPAMGSGNFLIVALNFLYTHAMSYVHNKTRWTKCEFPPNWQVDLFKDIASTCFYGVEIIESARDAAHACLILTVAQYDTDEAPFGVNPGWYEQLSTNIFLHLRTGDALIGCLSTEYLICLSADERPTKSDCNASTMSLLTEKYGGLDDIGKYDPADVAIWRPFHWLVEFPEVCGMYVYTGHGFDVVIGNPPWDVVQNEKEKQHIPLYGQRSRYDAFRDYVKRCNRFPVTSKLSGKAFNLWKLFVERMYCLSTINGWLGIIVPGNLLKDDTCSGLRRLLWHEMTMMSCIHFAEGAVWPDVSQTSVAIVARRNSSVVGLKANYTHEFLCRVPCAAILSDMATMRLPTTRVDMEDQNVDIPLVIDYDAMVLYRRMRTSSRKLGDVVKWHQGDLNETTHASHFSKQSDPSEQFPVVTLKGKNITGPFVPSFMREADRYFACSLQTIPPVVKRMGAGTDLNTPNVARIALGQIMTQETSKPRLKAVLIPPGWVVLNSCNVGVVIPEFANEFPLEFVCGFLNARLIDWMFRVQSSNNNISIVYLNALPLPPKESMTKENVDEICVCVTELSDLIRSGITDGEPYEGRMARLNDAVFRMFDVSPNERRAVDNWYTLNEITIAASRERGKPGPNSATQEWLSLVHKHCGMGGPLQLL